MSFDQVKELILILLPPLSVLAGVGLTSYLSSRRKDKDLAATDVMQKKIEVYDNLYHRLSNAYQGITDIFEQAKKAKSKADLEKLRDEAFPRGLSIMNYLDRNTLFVDEDISIHVGATLMAPASLADLNPRSKNYQKDLEELDTSFREDYHNGVELMKDYMGITRLEKSFKKINKPKTASQFVEYARHLRKQRDK